MPEPRSSPQEKTPHHRLRLGLALGGVIALGILSRLANFDSPLLNNYLGDALYAVMLYLLISLVWPTAPLFYRAGLALGLVWAIEIFQLTPWPAQLRQSENLILRLVSFALGTTFGWVDMLAYGLGIAGVSGVEYGLRQRRV